MPFDADRFRKLYPRRPYPDVRFLSERARYAAGRRLAERLGEGDGEDAGANDAGGGGEADLLWGNFDRAAPVAGASASAAGLDLFAVLAACDLPAPYRLVKVEWYTGDGIEVPSADLGECFPAFWREGEDDLAVFDDSGNWVLFVIRDGEIRILRADRAGRAGK